MSEETKDRILKEALHLFAHQGYAGTSIRDIAQLANVNVAAINYHFQTKENLFRQLVASNFDYMENEIRKISEEGRLTVADLSWKIYLKFLENGDGLLAMYKLLLSDLIDQINPKRMDDGLIGPPGSQFLLESITREVGEKIPYESRLWAIFSIFSHIVYQSLMLSSSIGKTHLKNHPYFTQKTKRENISFFVSAILEKIQKSKAPISLS